jgi:peroxiredoxin
MDKRKFIIECEIPERWVNDFCTMLNWMQSCGNLGHSSLVGFYADGDGDFRPKFSINTDWEKTEGIWRKDGKLTRPPEVLFDAG